MNASLIRTRILVLDDDASAGMTNASALKALGFAARSEKCVGKSIRSILKGNFDILLTKYPVRGLDGLQVSLLLRSMDAKITVLLVTDRVASFGRLDLGKYGISGVISPSAILSDICNYFGLASENRILPKLHCAYHNLKV